MTDEAEPTNRWGTAPDSTELHNLDYDFDGYFDRHRDGLLGAGEAADFSARIYGLFCSSFYKSGGDPAAVPAWVMSYVAGRLYEALQGRPWPDTMRLPWDEPTPQLTPRGKRAMEIFSAIENRKKAEPISNTTDLIAWQAGEQAVSYETARADYYTMKKAIYQKEGIPKKFLIDGDLF